jgi:hypothetical protein
MYASGRVEVNEQAPWQAEGAKLADLSDNRP